MLISIAVRPVHRMTRSMGSVPARVNCLRPSCVRGAGLAPLRHEVPRHRGTERGQRRPFPAPAGRTRTKSRRVLVQSWRRARARTLPVAASWASTIRRSQASSSSESRASSATQSG